jgi:hypothetical protein
MGPGAMVEHAAKRHPESVPVKRDERLAATLVVPAGRVSSVVEATSLDSRFYGDDNC